LPELPAAKYGRFRSQYGLSAYDAGVLTTEPAVADYFEQAVAAISEPEKDRVSPKNVANWVSGELFGLLNQAGVSIEMARVPPEALATLASMVARGQINQNTAKQVLAEMFSSGESPEHIVDRRGLRQITDAALIADLVHQVLMENSQQVADYRSGKESLFRWLMGQVMHAAQGQANPQIVQQELERQIHRMES
jgi:aspartyl-tRNA(Asn)/glutamyl-tRNA(Gln) amidotransferase subunit B